MSHSYEPLKLVQVPSSLTLGCSMTLSDSLYQPLLAPCQLLSLEVLLTGELGDPS